MQGHHRRLTHITTKNNLYTHGIKSPLSNQHKVTGFGNIQGDSDNGDDWRVTCSSGDEYWVLVKKFHLGRCLAGSKMMGTPSGRLKLECIYRNNYDCLLLGRG